METNNTDLFSFISHILEYIKENSSQFNEEKLDIMRNIPNYLRENLNDEESIMVYDQIKSIKKSISSEILKNDFDDEYNNKFVKRDLMSLGTNYLLALSVDKNILSVDENLIYYLVNSLRGEEYKDYPCLLKGLLYEKLLNGAKTMQAEDSLDTDRLRLVFSNLVDKKILLSDTNEENFDLLMQTYLNKSGIPNSEGLRAKR